MSATAFYNEIDPYAAHWLRNLIEAGHIAPGIVDERSIEDISPEELTRYTQCHFFAGVGVWSYALRRAGWHDSRPVWTGSCPCQPFSSAGAGSGFADERHLWPAFHHLIAEHAAWCRRRQLPLPVIFGEQVASKDADSWLDLVQTDMEALAYAFGALAFPSASIGAPHIRDRTYWVGNAYGKGLEGHAWNERATRRQGQERPTAEASISVRLADAELQQRPFAKGDHDVSGGRIEEPTTSSGLCCDLRPNATNGYWRDADWLGCTDGKWRPVEPGTFPLADGSASDVGRVRADQERLAAHGPRKDQGSRTGRLKGYGNAINAEQARIFIETVMDWA